MWPMAPLPDWGTASLAGTNTLPPLPATNTQGDWTYDPNDPGHPMDRQMSRGGSRHMGAGPGRMDSGGGEWGARRGPGGPGGVPGPVPQVRLLVVLVRLRGSALGGGLCGALCWALFAHVLHAPFPYSSCAPYNARAHPNQCVLN